MRKILLVTGVLFMLFACSKEKKVLKKISGEWLVVSYQLDSADVSENALELYSAFGIEYIKMNFSDCEEGSECNLYSSYLDENNVVEDLDTSSYSISEDGDFITIDTELINIEKLTSSTLELHRPTSEILENYSETMILEKL